MHYALHILLHYVALGYAINGGVAIGNTNSPILTTFIKNVASTIHPAFSELRSRKGRSSLESNLTTPTDGTSDNPRSLDNMVDGTSNTAVYYEPYSKSYPYNSLHEDSSKNLEIPQTSEFEGSLRDESYLKGERPNFYGQQLYRPYNFLPNNNYEASRGVKASANTDGRVEPLSVSNIEVSSSNQYSSYHGAGLPKAAFAHGPYPGLGPKPYDGFHGFGPYGHFHHHPPYHNGGGNGGGNNGPQSTNGEAASEANARLENNSTNGRRVYGPPFGAHDYNHPYPSFPYGGYPVYNPYYGPPRGSENGSSANRQNGGAYGPPGPFYGGPDFYGPFNYGYNHGYNRNNNNKSNGNNNNNRASSRQTEEPAKNGDQINSTKNGYPRGPFYGPPLVKSPPLGAFHLHSPFPSPFNLLPFDHYHFKGGLAAGVGHVGYPLYADPYPIGFPSHPYGPFFHGKHDYLPPKDKPSDAGGSGEQTEAPAGELTENGDPGRITAISQEEVAPAPSSNRYKASQQKLLKRLGLSNIEPGRPGRSDSKSNV